MKNPAPRACPVCWCGVNSTPSNRIERHWDSIGREICPGGSEPFGITIAHSETRAFAVERTAAFNQALNDARSAA